MVHITFEYVRERNGSSPCTPYGQIKVGHNQSGYKMDPVWIRHSGRDISEPKFWLTEKDAEVSLETLNQCMFKQAGTNFSLTAIDQHLTFMRKSGLIEKFHDLFQKWQSQAPGSATTLASFLNKEIHTRGSIWCGSHWFKMFHLQKLNQVQ